MAFVHEMKFFKQNDLLFAALFEAPNRYSSEFWLKNVPALDLGIEKLPQNVELEQKYTLETLGFKPFFFYITVPKLEFINSVAEAAWKTGEMTTIGSFLP